jgi:predicted TIM-barrel fold metal-dependent hydrolase
MADRSAWLELTREAVLEPELPICDSHHHLWDYPDSRYLVDEFLRDIDGDSAGNSAGGHKIISSVFVECLQFYRAEGPPELRPVGETEFVDSIAGMYPAPGGKVAAPAGQVNVPAGQVNVAAGIVGFADLALGAAVEPVLEAHMAASARFRGVRHASAWDASEQVHNAHTRPVWNLLQTDRFRQGLACVEGKGLSFDAWLFHPQIPQLTELAQAIPDLPIVLNHMAGPLGIGPYAGQREEVFGQWRRNMAELARCENVCVKLGGRTLSSAGFGWHKRAAPPGSAELAVAMAPYFHACIELFGAGRCMFESDFPVDKASCSYTVLWNAFKRLTADYSKAERSALFCDTAMRFYRLA